MAIITISREFGCAAEMVAEIIAKKLNYKIMNKEIIEYVSILTDIDKKVVESYDEERHSNFKATISKYIDFSVFKDIFKFKDEELNHCKLVIEDKDDLFSEKIDQDLCFDSDKYQKTVETVFRKLAEKDNVIIIGRGGQFILKDDPKALHIRLYADLKYRLKWVCEKENIDTKTAVNKIAEVEKRKRNYITHYYGQNAEDVVHYHLAINMGRLNVEEVAELIISAINIKEFDQPDKR